MITYILAGLALIGCTGSFDHTRFSQAPLETASQKMRVAEDIGIGHYEAEVVNDPLGFQVLVKLFGDDDAVSLIKMVGGRDSGDKTLARHGVSKSGLSDYLQLPSDRSFGVFSRGFPVVFDGNRQPHSYLVGAIVVFGPFLQNHPVEIKICRKFFLGVPLGDLGKLHSGIRAFVSSVERASGVRLTRSRLIPGGEVKSQRNDQTSNAGAGEPDSNIGRISSIASRISSGPLRAQIGISIALLPLAWVLVLSGLGLRDGRHLSVSRIGLGLLCFGLSFCLWWLARPQ